MFNKVLRNFTAGIFMAVVAAVSVQASVVNIAQNDGTENFSAIDYTNGFGALGDANYIAANIASYNTLGSNVTIRVTIGNVIDYFRPTLGNTLLGMLTSYTNHLWSASETGSFIAPVYYNNHLGGSALYWPLINVFGDSRRYLNFWGDNQGLPGGCCTTNNDSSSVWGQAFTVDIITPVPLPAALPLLVVALGGLSFVARRRKAA
jgi:hypothetical protein